MKVGIHADQLLEQVSHVMVAEDLGMEVDGSELLEDLEQDAVAVELVDGLLDLIVGEDVLDVLGEPLDIVDQVLAQIGGVLAQGFEGILRAIPEGLLGRLLGIETSLVVGMILDGLQNGRLGGLEDAIEAPQDDKGEDDLTILMALIAPPEQLKGSPDGRSHPGDVRRGSHLSGDLDKACHSYPPRQEANR